MIDFSKLFEQSLEDASLDDAMKSIDSSVPDVNAGAVGTSPGFGMDTGMGIGGGFGDMGMGTTGTDSFTTKLSQVQQSISSSTDIGRVKMLTNISSVINDLSNFILGVIHVSKKFAILYDSLLEAQEILETVILNLDKFKEKIDVIIALYQMLVVEHTKIFVRELKKRVSKIQKKSSKISLMKVIKKAESIMEDLEEKVTEDLEKAKERKREKKEKKEEESKEKKEKKEEKPKEEKTSKKKTTEEF